MILSYAMPCSRFSAQTLARHVALFPDPPPPTSACRQVQGGGGRVPLYSQSGRGAGAFGLPASQPPPESLSLRKSALLDSRLFLRSSFARSVLARAASPRDAALSALPAVLMAVAMPPTVLVLVVQNHPSASLATASCRARGTWHACAHCTSRRPPSVPLFVRGLAPSPRAPYLWRPRSGPPPR